MTSLEEDARTEALEGLAVKPRHVATLIELYGSVDPKQLLDVGKQAVFAEGAGTSAKRRPVPRAAVETT